MLPGRLPARSALALRGRHHVRDGEQDPELCTALRGIALPFWAFLRLAGCFRRGAQAVGCLFADIPGTPRAYVSYRAPIIFR